MPEVIVDTSPIQYLYQLGLLHLLHDLYSHVLIPEAVAAELAQGRSQSINLPDTANVSWIVLRQVPESLLMKPIPNLGAGELEVLSLATGLADCTVVLDDAFARRLAQQMGMRCTGTLGVLLKAKQAGFVAAIAPLLDQLDSLRFRLDRSTRAAVLRLAKEDTEL